MRPSICEIPIAVLPSSRTAPRSNPLPPKMKGRPIDQLVYERMFPTPKPTDPRNFQELLQAQIVPEVRHETQAFYGSLSSQEAKYPGLDYSHKPHRNRLSRYTWHKRLFRAFDDLRLTPNEIAILTKWEGTRSAKERFEKEQGVVIRDTTADEIEDWVEPELRPSGGTQAQRADVEEMDDIQEAEDREARGADEEMDEDSDMEIHSVGNDLNERLRAAVAQREAGNTSTILDEEWEQWFKDAVEAGSIPFLSPDLSPNANIPGTRPASNRPAAHSSLLDAMARLPDPPDLSDFQQFFMRRNTQARSRRSEDTTRRTLVEAAMLNNTASPFLSRPSLSPRARAVPSSAAGGNSTFQRLVNRLDDHFADHFVRRPVPPLPSDPTTAARSTLSAARHRLSRSQQGGS